MDSRYNKSFIMLMAIVGVLAVLLTQPMVESRYLPTRADDTNLDLLRDLIKDVLVQTSLEELEAQMATSSRTRPIGPRFAALTRARRSVELINNEPEAERDSGKQHTSL